MKKKMLFSKKGQRGAALVELVVATALIIVAALVAKGYYDMGAIQQLPEYQNLQQLIKNKKADPSSVTDEQLRQALENFRSAVSDQFGDRLGDKLMSQAEETLDKIRNQQYVIKISVNPADPAPFQTVSVTVTVLNSLEGTSVSYSVVGTDSYTQNGTLSTDKNGQVFFSIPGGAEGVVDVITVTVGSVTEEYTYQF